MLFRRHLGIMTFVFAMIHWCLEGVFPTVFAKQEPLQATFIVFGFIAFILMAILFFTSNDWSVRMLGKWWGRLHSLVYIIAWLIFCHLILLGMSFQMVIIGLLAILETASLIFSFLKKRLQPAVAQTDR